MPLLSVSNGTAARVQRFHRDVLEPLLRPEIVGKLRTPVDILRLLEGAKAKVQKFAEAEDPPVVAPKQEIVVSTR